MCLPADLVLGFENLLTRTASTDGLLTKLEVREREIGISL